MQVEHITTLCRKPCCARRHNAANDSPQWHVDMSLYTQSWLRCIEQCITGFNTLYTWLHVPRCVSEVNAATVLASIHVIGVTHRRSGKYTYVLDLQPKHFIRWWFGCSGCLYALCRLFIQTRHLLMYEVHWTVIPHLLKVFLSNNTIKPART